MNQAEAVQATPTTIEITMPELKEGEIYIGSFINADGTGHHTILLPGDYDPAPWKEHMNRAAADNADLPNRAELVTMYENFKGEFKETVYWSNTQHASYSDYAWLQYFDGGSQDHWLQGYYLRARAVRRVAI